MELHVNKDTQLCMSLAARPGNFGTRFQNFLYRELGLNFLYKAFATQDIKAAIDGIRALGVRGCAISMPFKETCIGHLDELDESARRIMSVNTIVNEAGRLRGHNTDYVAIRRLLEARAISPETSFAVRGSGGMAKAVVCALRDLGFREGWIVARNEQVGPALAERYGYHWRSRLDEARPGLLINATSIGMSGGGDSSAFAFAPEVVESAQVVFDVVAVPAETPLIKQAAKFHRPVISGAEVVVLQAVEQFVLYTGIRPQPDLIRRARDFAVVL